MQKKLIALAVAGLVSAPAFAQSNVTIYGVADLGLGYIDGGKAGDVTGLADGAWAGSRLGFRGTEDLGNGLKAVFTLEYGLDLDSNTGLGNSSDAARQQFVGLAGGFGTVVAGRLQTPGYYFAGKYVPLGGYASVHDFMAGTGAGYTIEDSSRIDNAVAYMTPNFSGFSATLVYGFGSEVNETNAYDTEAGNTTGGTNEADSVVAVGLNYDNGPVSVGLVYHGIYNVDKSNAVGSDEDINEWALGGSYDFGVAKLFATYQQREVGKIGGRDYEDDLWTVGVSAPIGAAGVVSLAYGQHDGDGANNEADAWSLGYTHALSKRTSLYAMYARMSTENGFVGISDGSSSSKGIGLGGERVAILGDEDIDRIAIGVNHKF